MSQEIWQRVLQRLKKTIDENIFSTWIVPLKLAKIEGQICTFKVVTKFTGDWVGRNFGDSIRQHFLGEGVHIDRLVFEVDQEGISKQTCAPKEAGAAALRAPIANAPNGALISGGALDPRFTFERFVVGVPNQLAFAAARRVADGGVIAFNPLFLYGGVGFGKTHLMQAIACELRERNPEAKVFYLSAEQFMYRFVQSLRNHSMVDFKTLLRSVDVLMIDDIQFIAGKSSTQDEFIHTFNALIDQGKQIVVSAACPPAEIAGLDERIGSRLQSGLIADLHPSDYDLRLGILQRKNEYHSPFYPNVEIDDSVFEFLAHNINTNIRVLEGALNRLFAFGSLVEKKITLEIAQECLADLLRQAERKITLDEIMRRVAEYYKIGMSDMLSARRLRNFVRPRQIAMYLAKNLTYRSYPEIGRRFGGRDHTTVLHAVRRIEELKIKDEQIAADVDLLSRMLRI